MILKSHAFICGHTDSAHVFKMYKKCLFFVCVVFVLEVKSDCDGYFECFNSFFANFFANSDTNIEHINATSKNLPENFVQVKDVQISELDKVLSEISSFIQQDLTDQLKTQSDSALFKNVNPNTKVYVKTFSYNSPGNIILPDFGLPENISFNNDETEGKDTEITTVENSSAFTPLPQTTQNIEKSIIENQKDVSENEISKSDDIVSYYDASEDNATDYPLIDYVELYKDTTNEENSYDPTEATTSDINDEIQETLVQYVDGMEKVIWDINNSTDPSVAIQDEVSTLLPWISTIFVKNETKSNQFEYFCDGALLEETLVITAARCVNTKKPVNPEDILVIIGKKSLLSMAKTEKMKRVKKVITHENFKVENGKVENDLALLVLETVMGVEDFQPASIGDDVQDVDKSFTTAWNLEGDIVPISLEAGEPKTCNDSHSGAENLFCAGFGLDVALCPSYGGIFAGHRGGNWRLYGIRSADTSDRGLCFDKNIWFTNLKPYQSWISENSEMVQTTTQSSSTTEK